MTGIISMLSVEKGERVVGAGDGRHRNVASR